MCQGAETQQESLWSPRRLDDTYVQRAKQLGQGAFSKVYLGTHSSRSEDVAIKVIDRGSLCEEGEVRLLTEVSILREISSCNNVLKLHDAYREPHNYRLVFEYMDGGDLVNILEDQEQNCLDEMSSRDIMFQLMSALDFLHSRAIAHRDVKAENVLVSSNGEKLVVKLADFGFAQKQRTPNCLTTLCGSPSYVAPELLKQLKYSVKCDLWSAGVLAFVLLGGYQPFHGKTEDDTKNNIVKGSYSFDGKFWSHVSCAAKDFIETILVVDPEERAAAEDMLSHSWFVENLLLTAPSAAVYEKPAIFMIGSQRSGSNWLRTMIDQRDDLAGPHPPHVMREFMPIVKKFGDLENEDNFKVLVDHVTTFVERNQVPWTDKYGQKLMFCRQTVHEKAKASCERLRVQEQDILGEELYLLSIFDAVMDFFADANGKNLWMCKSMGMSAYHDSLLKFYGQKRLRYIYLVRDPRDVAMSFMKTPVGDKHHFAITKKWVKLQGHAVRILESTPDILCLVKYEELLKHKENVVSCIYDFIGDRRFGGVKREASVMSIVPVAQSIGRAKTGWESVKAHLLSQQFKNLCRGESFAREQMAKWAHPETGLKNDELIIIESLAYEVMKYFGYDTAAVKSIDDVVVFTEDQIEEFARLNEAGIDQMYQDLKRDNPEDLDRRIYQAEVLSFDPQLLTGSSHWSIDHSMKTDLKKSFLLEQIKQRDIVKEYTEEGVLEGFGSFKCGAASQRGYYPDFPGKENQDSFDIRIRPSTNFFAVYDGHGPHGDRCSKLCKGILGDIYGEYLEEGKTEKVALDKAHNDAHCSILTSSHIDSDVSGTTTAVVTLKKDLLTVAFAGDSAVIIGSHSSTRSSTFLTYAHDLSRLDEVARIERKGGLIMSSEEYDEIKGHLTSASSGSLVRTLSMKSLTKKGGVQKQSMSNLLDFSDRSGTLDVSERIEGPNIANHRLRGIIRAASTNNLISVKESGNGTVNRIWSAESTDKVPGCAFTRSLGDTIGKEIGVVSNPEFKQLQVRDGDIIVVASDGVTEYLNPQEIIEIVRGIEDPAAAAEELAKRAAVLWANNNDYCDDISAIVILIEGTGSNEISQSVISVTNDTPDIEEEMWV